MKMQRMQHRPVLVVLLTLAFLLSAMTPVALADRPQCLGTSLQVDITAAVVAEGVQDYDWNLTKSVKPESLLLGPGASGEVTYTIVAERLAQDPEITYTVSGTITVEMTGDYPTTGFQVTPYLARHVGGNDYEEVPGTRSANLADGEMSPDDSPLAFEYTLDIPPGAIDPDEDYKVFAGVSITNHPNDCPKPHLFPAKADVDFPDEPPIVTETDATATLEDAVDLSNADGLAYATGQEWPVTLTDSQTITYTATITNEGAECGQNGLEVTNTATLTPSDSAALTASATVSVTTPACEGVVSVSKTAEGYCRRSVEYDWTVTKKVSDTSLTLKAGESKQVTYTVTVTPEKVKDEVSAGVKGTITVTNDTDAPITLTGYHDWVEYLDGEDWTEVPNAGDTQTMSQTVPAGGFLDIPYDLPFTPVEGAQGYRNCVEVAFQPAVVVAAADFSAPKVSAEREFTLTCQESVEDETASIADVATWPTGFSYQLDDEFPTEFDATESEGPWTLTYKATLTNESVVCGQDVEVKNTVTLTEGDSEDTDQDDATVAVYTGNCNDPSTKRPGIKVTKDVDDHTLRVGQTAHYTYVVENT
ncbi:MAG: hypothetical protein QHH05_05815, partial [Syntrophomonadaceae bacterium]|nr:hypothetical protein [Syntrophomonadaceae bacterium]